MRSSGIFFVAFILFMTFECAYSQRSGRVNRSRNNYTTPKVRSSKARIICPTFDKGQYPLHSFGIKLGDPLALTYKFYPNKRLSLAVDIGKAASGLYNTYLQEKFKGYLRPDTLPSTESTLVYLSHKVKSDLVGEVKALYHIDATRVLDGLRAYAGAGWEWKRTEVEYEYEYRSPLTGQENADPFRSFGRSRVTMGPQLVVGIEYAYFQIPIVAFMEVEHFTDVQADPGWQRFEGGVGLRYVF